MKINFKKLIATIFLSVVVVGSVGCRGNSTSETSVNEAVSGIFTPTEEETVETTYTWLLRNGVTPYKIVIPVNTSETSDIMLAAEELQYFFSLPTGATLPIVKDNTIGNDTKGKYLSVGNTIIAKEAGLTPDFRTLGTDGYRIKTHGDAVAMLGGDDFGTMFSVYGYINKQFGLKIYAADCFTYEETKNEKLVDLDITEIPDIAHRTGGSWFGASWEPWALNSKEAKIQRSRYRMTCCWEEPYALMSHTHFTILPPDLYYNDHPDWYVTPSETRTTWQLDVSNQEMWPEFIKRLKTIISSGRTEGIVYYQLGVEDNGNEPDNERYLNLKAELGGVASGVQLYFMNYVVQDVNAWVAENFPNLEIAFTFYAYGDTFLPAPIKTVSLSSGETVYELYQYTDPYDGQVKDLKPVENLYPMVTPIMQHRSHGYLDDTNPGSKAAFEAWDALSEGMHVWAYETYFADFLSPFNEWASFKQNYMDYVELGVSWVFEEGAPYKTPNFMELRQYLMSQLMWDTTLDTEVLIVEFMQAFYGDGWEDVYNYFNLMRYRLYEMEKVPSNDRKYAYINDNLELNYEQRTSWFPVTLLQQCERYLESALSKVEKDGYYYKNIECARIPNRYLLLSMYNAYYDKEEYQAMVYDFKRVIQEYGADERYGLYVTYDSLINGWLSKVA